MFAFVVVFKVLALLFHDYSAGARTTTFWGLLVQAVFNAICLRLLLTDGGLCLLGHLLLGLFGLIFKLVLGQRFFCLLIGALLFFKLFFLWIFF
jgi:hypothetical protein